MQSVTKNGITVSFPDEIKPGEEYEITYSVNPSTSYKSIITDFWIITKGGAKMNIRFTQAGKTIVS